jgi:SET domain-containing protein
MIRAEKDIKKGEEILVNYGTHYNGVFLNPALE